MRDLVMPEGFAWDRRWCSLARLTRDGEIVGEVQLHNGTWYGRVDGSVVATCQCDNGLPFGLMGHVVEVAIRMP